jgi:hypothetical protein
VEQAVKSAASSERVGTSEHMRNYYRTARI